MARQVAFGKESTYDTGVTPTDVVEASSETLEFEKTKEQIATIRSNSTRKAPTLAEKTVGDVTIPSNYQDVGLLFKALLGSVDTTGAGPYTHTLPASTGIALPRPALTAELERDSGLVFTYTGLKVIGHQFSATVGSVSEDVWSFLGSGNGSTTTGSATSITFPDFDCILPTEVTVSFDAANLDAKSVQLNVGYPVDEPNLLGATGFGKEPEENEVLSVEGTITVLFDNFTQYAKFTGDTEIDLQINCTDGTHKRIYNCNKVLLSQATPHNEGRQRLEATYSFFSIYDTDATENIQVVLVNDDATIP